MKYLVTLITFLLMNQNIFAQAGSTYKVITDEKSGGKIFDGPITFDDLLNEPTFSWFEAGAKQYQPEAAAIEQLVPFMNKYEIIITMGTWCGDSKDLVPKMYAVLEATQFPMGQYKMYGVDREKFCQGVDLKSYDVQRVPTFIIMRAGQEIGRIVETVQTSIESDLAAIIIPDATKQ